MKFVLYVAYQKNGETKYRTVAEFSNLPDLFAHLASQDITPKQKICTPQQQILA